MVSRLVRTRLGSRAERTTGNVVSRNVLARGDILNRPLVVAAPARRRAGVCGGRVRVTTASLPLPASRQPA